MDRFFVSLSIGYPDQQEEEEIILRQQTRHPIESLTPVVTPDIVLAIQQQVSSVHVDNTLRSYIMKIILATRTDSNLMLGSSPRGSISLYKAVQAFAALNGRDYVIPEDIKSLAVPVLKHRIILKSESKLKNLKPESVIERILSTIPVPMEEETQGTVDAKQSMEMRNQ